MVVKCGKILEDMMVYQIIIILIILIPIIIRLIDLHFYSNKESIKKENDVLIIIFDAFSELLNGKCKKNGKNTLY